jgi:hypothetical protein
MIILILAVRLLNNGISAQGAPGIRWRFDAGNLGKPGVDHNPALTLVIFVGTQCRVAEGPGGGMNYRDIPGLRRAWWFMAGMVSRVASSR